MILKIDFQSMSYIDIIPLKNDVGYVKKVIYVTVNSNVYIAITF